jgi:hypothetical protein
MAVMTVQPEAVPAEERRGGELPDWDHAYPGQPLPDYGDGDADPRFAAPDDSCSLGSCEDDRDLRHYRGVRADGELHRRVGIGWRWCGLAGCGGD